MKFEISDSTKKRWETELYTVCSFCNKEYTFNEYMQSKSIWVDSKQKQYGKTVLCECGVDLFSERWIIISKRDNYFVMTVHMPIKTAGVEFQDWFDYNFWYETKFWQENPKSGKREFAAFEQRYHTREDAIEGHKFVVENLTKIVENPEGFPQGVLDMMCNSMRSIASEKKVISSDVKERLT